jgi:hypothetical protein
LAFARQIATEQTLAGASLKVFFGNLGDKIGTDPHVLQLRLLDFFGQIPLAPVGQEKQLGELVDLANTMRRTTECLGANDAIDALDKCYIHPLFVQPQWQTLQVSRRVFEYAIDRMVNHVVNIAFTSHRSRRGRSSHSAVERQIALGW